MLVSILLYSSLISFCYMSAIFVLAVIKKDNSIVDVAWGIGFILITLFSFFYNGLYLPRHILVTSLVLIWGIRISTHIGWRNWGKGEDSRYRAWRESWKHYFLLRSFLQIFMLQGFVLLIVCYPVLLINASKTSGLNILDYLGLMVWVIGFYFEVVGDYQLFNFLSKPENKGKIMKYGLWQHTRHPNYFGEAAMWWGIFLIALSVPYGWTTIMSPLTITLLLRFVSGVPLAERLFDNNPEYQQYKKQTNPLFPWFVKNKS